jgi:hypothetical protein
MVIVAFHRLRLTSTPAHVRLDKLPLLELGQHNFYYPSQPPHSFLGHRICRMRRMRPWHRNLDRLFRSERRGFHEPGVPWELVT